MKDVGRPFSKRYEHGFDSVLDHHCFYAPLGSLVGSQRQKRKVTSFLYVRAGQSKFSEGHEMAGYWQVDSKTR